MQCTRDLTGQRAVLLVLGVNEHLPLRRAMVNTLSMKMRCMLCNCPEVNR